MPASRTVTQARIVRRQGGKELVKKPGTRLQGNTDIPFVPVAAPGETVDLAQCEGIFYPVKTSDRGAFRHNGKLITPHQWNVYDFVRRIPVGKVITYRDVCRALGEGSPRSVGAALRNNPFAPYVPCHRIVASNGFIGGFCGEWGQDAGTKTQANRKMRMLAREGVGFTERGYLVGNGSLWRGPG